MKGGNMNTQITYISSTDAIFAEGRKIGLKEGRRDGQFMEKNHIAKKMLENQEPIEKIILYTGLTKNHIKTIKKQLLKER